MGPFSKGLWVPQPARRQQTGGLEQAKYLILFPFFRLLVLLAGLPASPARFFAAMDLDAYFARIGYDGSPSVNEDTLAALHAAHLLSVPYENLDIQLGQAKPLAETSFESRIVGQNRGGWCYEMNGLFSCALRQIGFEVDRLGGAVFREHMGDDTIGNHMVLTVHLDGRKLVADVGLGDGPLYPFPLEEREWEENGFTFGLGPIEDDYWRFKNHEHGLAGSFDFQETARNLSWYAGQCEALQSGDESVFVQLAMTFRRDEYRMRALRELTYLEIEGTKKEERRISTFEEYKDVLVPLIDFELGDDLERLFGHVHARVAKREREAAEH